MAGCRPYFPIWLAIFHGRAQHGDHGELIPSGGITFQMQGGKLLEDSVVKVELPGKAKNSWRRDWFYYQEETPAGKVAIPPFSLEPSRPCRLGVKKLPGDPPYFPLWLAMFHGRAQRERGEDGELIPYGGITFQM